MKQLALCLTACAGCRAGRRHDATHDRGCYHRWLTVGESFDELTPAEQIEHHARMLRAGVTRVEILAEYSAGLYRGPEQRKAGPAANSAGPAREE